MYYVFITQSQQLSVMANLVSSLPLTFHQPLIILKEIPVIVSLQKYISVCL